MDAEPTPPSRRRGLLELSTGYALILIVIWTPRPGQRWLYTSAAIYLMAILWSSFDPKAMGLRTANLARSIWVPGVALLIAVAAIVIAHHTHTFQQNAGATAFFKRYWGYAIWAFAQQLLLQDFFLLRLLRLISRPRTAAMVAAVIFSIAHLPSPILTALTLAWGYAACLLFLRYRNLYPLALTHAILGITIAVTIPGPVTRNMRVGLGYLTYSRHHIPHHRP